MAMQNQYSLPSGIVSKLADMGYRYDSSMQAHIDDWLGWYDATNEFYDGKIERNGKIMSIHRLSIHPFRRVCREWASLLLNDRTTISLDGGTEDENAALQEWLRRTHFIARAQGLVEKAYALGTGAWALWFDPQDDAIPARPKLYDARGTLPLSWDDDGCTECAFASRAFIMGKPVHQLQLHVKRDMAGNPADTYHVLSMAFDGRGAEVRLPDGAERDFDTGISVPTFGIVRPGITNIYSDGSAMGQSVCADAIGAIKLVDNAFDSLSREIDTTKAKVFMSDDLFDVGRDSEGRTYTKPMSFDDIVIRKVSGNGVDPLLQIYAPDIRIEPLRSALDAALAELGDLTGFGEQYFRLDQPGGLKTATEVSSDNSALMRNIRKHEIVLGDAIEQVCEAALAYMGYADASVSVDFDDSIITDTATEKAQLMSEVASGIAAPWEYRARFYGESPEEAQANVPESVAEPAIGTME